MGLEQSQSLSTRCNVLLGCANNAITDAAIHLQERQRLFVKDKVLTLNIYTLKNLGTQGWQLTLLSGTVSFCNLYAGFW